MTTIRAISLIGVSGSGKTTLLERLLPALRRRGVRVGVVKHSHHARLDDERPGKDTARLRAAGAVAVRGVTGEDRASLEDAVAGFPFVDLIVVEGWRALRLPAVEVVGPGGERRAPAEFGAPLLVAADERVAATAPCYPRDDVEGIAAHLVEQLGLSAPG